MGDEDRMTSDQSLPESTGSRESIPRRRVSEYRAEICSGGDGTLFDEITTNVRIDCCR